MNRLSVPEVENLRALVLENASELLAEATILFDHKKYARACALAHFSSEELAKLPMLAGVGIDLLRERPIDWKRFKNKLSSHSAKLKILLFVDLLSTEIDPTIPEIPVHELNMSRIDIFNTLKNVALYAGVYQDSHYKPSALFNQSYALSALTLSTNRLRLFTAVEAHTRGRLIQLQNCGSYMKLLKTLRSGNEANTSFQPTAFGAC